MPSGYVPDRGDVVRRQGAPSVIDDVLAKARTLL
jgi:hypothetical protein